MKTINVLPVEELEIKFKDGKTYKASFNMLAVGYMQQALLSKDVEEISVPEFGAVVLYGTIKANDAGFTLDEARALALAMRPADLNDIIQEYMDSMGADNELAKESQKKVIAQMLTKMAGLK